MSSITKETFKTGDFIFFEGDEGSHFYIIETGEVHIMTKDKANQHIIVGKLQDGDSFGEFALIDRSPRTASALAKVDTKVIKISKEGYEMMMNDLPMWATSMLKSFSNRIVNMNGILKSLTEAINQSKY